MASIFKPPYISSEQLASLMVEDGQLVFNTDDKQFYTGNGSLGGRNIAVSVPIPSKTSDLINDSGFITNSEIDFDEINQAIETTNDRITSLEQSILDIERNMSTIIGESDK